MKNFPTNSIMHIVVLVCMQSMGLFGPFLHSKLLCEYTRHAMICHIIVGKFDEELNLAIAKKTAKLNSANVANAFAFYITHASNRQIQHLITPFLDKIAKFNTRQYFPLYSTH